MKSNIVLNNGALIFLLIGLILASGCVSPNEKPENVVDNIKSEETVDAQEKFDIKTLKTEDDKEENQMLAQNSEEKIPEKKENEPEIVIFTNQIFDPKLVSHITPLGELNGGYEEAQTIAGVMINLKTEAVDGGKEIEVHA